MAPTLGTFVFSLPPKGAVTAWGGPARRRRQNSIRLRLGPDTPQQTLGLQPCTATGTTGRIAAVLGQQHADVHLVSLGLQVGKEAVDAKPMLAPLAVPVGRSVNNPTLLLGGELAPRRVSWNARRLGVAHQIILALLPGGGLHRFHSARAQRQFVIGNDQAQIHTDHATKATAGFARAHRGVERKHGRNRVRVTDIALRAVQASGEAPHNRLRICYHINSVMCIFCGGWRLVYHIDIEPAAATLKCEFNGFKHTGFFDAGDAKAVGNHVQYLAGGV